MNSVVKDMPAEISPPVLVPLCLDLHVNTAHELILDNLRAAYGRTVPDLDVSPDSKSATLAIVGSGPSLKNHWHELSQFDSIMALNGAYNFLLKRGVTPEWFAMLDARSVNTNFVESPCATTKHLLASQVHPAVYEKLDGYSVIAFHLKTPATDEVFGESVTKFGAAHTIGLTSLVIAAAMGYRKVGLFGFDSSYEEEASHAVAQPQNADEPIIPVYLGDRLYSCTHAMAAQAESFKRVLSRIKIEWPDFEVSLHGEGLLYDFARVPAAPVTRGGELAKYVTAYQDPHYCMTKPREDALDKVLAQAVAAGCKTYLDVSCGRGESITIAESHGLIAAATETVPDLIGGKVIEGVLPALPFADKSFDVVSLIEVIEHLVPEDVIPALLELDRIAKKQIIISAATSPAWHGNVDLHPSARTESRWNDLFVSIWGDKVSRLSHDFPPSPAWRVTF